MNILTQWTNELHLIFLNVFSHVWIHMYMHVHMCIHKCSNQMTTLAVIPQLLSTWFLRESLLGLGFTVGLDWLFSEPKGSPVSAFPVLDDRHTPPCSDYWPGAWGSSGGPHTYTANNPWDWGIFLDHYTDLNTQHHPGWSGKWWVGSYIN